MTKPIDTKIYWLSCPLFTISVKVRFYNGKWRVDHGLHNAPIAKRFHGQPWQNLVNWARSRGETKIVELEYYR